MSIELVKRLQKSFFQTYRRVEYSIYEAEPMYSQPIYGVYHVMCAEGWKQMVEEQLLTLKRSGLLDHTKCLYVSIIVSSDDDVDVFKRIACIPQLDIISIEKKADQYEYPALKFIQKKARQEKALFYYFHTKGISYQCGKDNGRLFRLFWEKIRAWRVMLEFFIFTKWRVAINALNNGYDAYGCYQWPPDDYKMFSGNFWWTTSDYVQTLPELEDAVIAQNRFYSEQWIFESNPHVYSLFETIVDLYFVRIPSSIYMYPNPPFKDRIRYVLCYNWRKFQKHFLGYNYKYVCQRRFQKK